MYGTKVFAISVSLVLLLQVYLSDGRSPISICSTSYIKLLVLKERQYSLSFESRV